MTKKLLLGISLAAVFAVSMIAVSAVEPWMSATGTSATKGNNFLLTVDAADTVPKNTQDLGGFAWAYAGGPYALFAITTHQGVRDSHQNPDHWHAHNVNIIPGTTTDLCVTDLSDFVEAGISMKGDQVTVQISSQKLTGPIAGFATGFEIVPNAPGCPPVDFADKFEGIDGVLALGVNAAP
jgi:hypothetical protein